MTEHLVIVGGGQAASQAIQSLRQGNYAGAITLVGAEPYLPYQRPPLSKKYLSGELERERLLLRPASFYDEKNVALEIGRCATRLDVAKRRLELDDGRTLDYHRVLLAMGSRVRRLNVPGATLPGVHYLRTIADVDGFAAALVPGARIVLVGAGFIGLEVAAVAAQRGCKVTVLEAERHVLARAVSPVVADFYAAVHRAAGVDLRLGVTAAAFEGGDRVSAVSTTGGESFPCDVAIVGIGVLPNVELAATAGLAVHNGIVVDEHARTADHNVLAAGDCTNHPLPPDGRRVRLESVPNAIHQARVAAATLLGQASPYSEVPWFWSDQYDLKLQIVGLSTGYDEVVVRGDPGTRSFAAFYLAGGALIAVDAINKPREFLAGKKLVATRACIPTAQLADPNVDLNALAP